MKFMYGQRLSFTLFWEGLNKNVRSAVISLGAIVVCLFLVSLAKFFFPTADFSKEQLVILTAISAFISNLLKESARV